ncbi:MAG: hypothetical protein ACRD2H_01125 [Terriglobales bacterium]
MQELATEGAIPADLKVRCLIEEPEAALEISLMENTARAGFQPVDEFLAMAALIETGETVEAIALRFGVSERHVRQRLRLGKIAPELLDEFRAGALSLEVLTAFTLGADHESQRAIWRQVKDQHTISPHTVRRLLTRSAVPLDSPLSAFVGAAAYEAAGGTITRDLFSGDEEGFLGNAALVRRLAIEKLEAKAEELRPHWAWTKAVLDPDYGFLAQYGRIRPRPVDPAPEIAQESARIEERLAALETLPEDAWSAGLISEAAELEDRRDELAEVVAGLAVYADEDRARAGVIVTVGEDGDFCLHQGLVERRARRDEDAADPLPSGDESDDPESGEFGGPSRTLTTAMVDRRGLAPRSAEQAVRTGLRQAGRSSATAGCGIMPTTRSRRSPPRSKPLSIPPRASPASVSVRWSASAPPAGCRPA